MGFNIGLDFSNYVSKIKTNSNTVQNTTAAEVETEEVDENDGLDVFTKTNGTETATETTTETATAANATAKKEQLENQKKLNEEKIKKIDEQIKQISEEIKTQVENALQEIERISDEQIENVNNITQNLLAELEAGNITKDEFNSKLQGDITALGVDSKVASQVLKITNANNNVSIIEHLAAQISALVQTNQQLDTQIADCVKQIEAEAQRRKCDPIGFELNGVKYDFFVDSDNNKNISNAQEFLGAKNGWSEVTQLDADGNGMVQNSELSSLMVVVTQKDGTQSVMNAVDLFGENDGINLNSYKTAETQSIQGTGITSNILGTDESGKNLNTLVGTFGLTFKEKDVSTGYQTLDDMDWLSQNYKFTDNAVSENNYEATINELRTMVQEAMSKLGFSETMIKQMTDISKRVAKLDADTIVKNIEAEQEAQKETQAAQEAEAAEEAKANEESILEEEVAEENTEENTTTNEDNSQLKRFGILS